MVNKLLAGHEAMVEKLKGIMPDGNFTTQCVLQPLPALFARHSVERGGNVLGRDQVTGNAVLWLGTVSAPTRELGDAAHGLLRAYATETEAHARELGLDMKAAATKYDPNGAFQTLMPGGFKISKV
ncbi:hypothetical protein RB598_009785 [Gaeumannomyces tritici]